MKTPQNPSIAETPELGAMHCGTLPSMAETVEFEAINPVDCQPCGLHRSQCHWGVRCPSPSYRSDTADVRAAEKSATDAQAAEAEAAHTAEPKDAEAAVENICRCHWN